MQTMYKQRMRHNSVLGVHDDAVQLEGIMKGTSSLPIKENAYPRGTQSQLG